MKPLRQSLLLFKKLTTPVGCFRKAQRTLALAFSLSLLVAMPLPQANALGIPNPITDFKVPEDWPNTERNLNTVFSDASEFTVLDNSNPSLVVASISGSVLILDYLENQSGSAMISIAATDGVSTVVNSFTVTVLPVNDFPFTTPAVLPDTTTTVNTPVSISFKVNDVEDDALSRPLAVSVSADINPIIMLTGRELIQGGDNNSECMLTLTPLPDAVGEAIISVTVRDDGFPQLSAIRSFKLTVTPSTDPNNPPVAVIKISPDADLDGGDPEIILISVNGVDALVTLDGAMSSDPDGDTLFHSWSLGVTGEPILNTRLPVGTHLVSLEVRDGKGGLDTAFVNVKVITVATAIEQLESLVNARVTGPGARNSLLAHLRNAKNYFGTSCDDGIAQLLVFIHQVSVHNRLNQLTRFGNGVTAELAVALKYLTDEIINNVTCP